MRSLSNQPGGRAAVFPFGRHASPEAAREKLAELRGLLAERFPESPRRTEEFIPTGFAPVDEAAGGGLPRAAVTEIVASAPSCGGQYAVRAMLETARRTHQYLALVDGSDSFDPQSEQEELLPHLFWVRCRQTRQALQAADLIVRDGNIELVLLDLRGNRLAEIRREPPGISFRLQRMVKKSGGILAVLTSRPIVISAAVRVKVGADRSQARNPREKAAG